MTIFTITIIMSLFTEFKDKELIKNPAQTGEYRKILKEKREKSNRKELIKEMRAKLPHDEYLKRWQVNYYQMNKERVKEYKKRKKQEEEEMIMELYKEVYDEIPEPINYDKFYADKYKEDDMGGGSKYKFYWRISRLNSIRVGRLNRITSPIRIYGRPGLVNMMAQLNKMQDKAYEYIKPHINEISIKDFNILFKQSLTKNPMRAAGGKMLELINNTDISTNQICSVASAMLRDKYIVSELYLGRISFLVGDIIITQAGNVFRPMLDNNIPWLTRDTVEELHQKRIDWFKKEGDLKIYILDDTYLTSIQINEREKYFYIIPT